MILPCSLVKIQYCPQEVLVAQFSLDGHKDGLNPHSFHLNKVTEHYIINIIYVVGLHLQINLMFFYCEWFKLTGDDFQNF